MKTYTVYLITCIPSGKMYVGITGLGMECRWGFHVRDAYSTQRRNKCRALAAAIVEYHPNSFSIECLRQTLSHEKAAMLEKNFIKELRTLSPNGLNLNSGGKYAYTLSPSTLEKLSVSARRAAILRYSRANERAASAEMMKVRFRDNQGHRDALIGGLKASWKDPARRASRIEKMREGRKNSSYVTPKWSEGKKSSLSALRKASWEDPEKRAKRVQGVKDWWARRKSGVVS